MRWADQLIKISKFEVELVQKRLGEIVERRVTAEMRLVMLTAEGEAEMQRAREGAGDGWGHAGFFEALKTRKLLAQAEIDSASAEEVGCRDALSEAFETLKKYEQVAESARVAAVKVEKRRETAALDEMGLRRAASGR